jgi:hypothetical protein
MTYTKRQLARRLLTVSNAKTIKGENLGYLTGILYLSPSTESGVMDTCRSATKHCIKACLKAAGRMRMPASVASRIWKTRLLHSDRDLFMATLRANIQALIRRSEREGLTPCVRINGTSDLPSIAREMAAEFPEVQFYDYTKHPKPWIRTDPNYYLTFSYSGENMPQAIEALEHLTNVSVVFDTPKGQSLPTTWNGYRVIDGDSHDLRFLDPRGVVIGLRAKGLARKCDSPFVVKTHSQLLVIAA